MIIVFITSYVLLLPAGITSIGTLSVLALERYLIISRPVNHGPLTRRTALLLVLAVWLYSFTLTFPPLVGWGEYGPEAANLRWVRCDVSSTYRYKLANSRFSPSPLPISNPRKTILLYI